jgi:hypothetical protein
MGNSEKSRKEYQEFLSIWKDADGDLPIFNEAKGNWLAKTLMTFA